MNICVTVSFQYFLNNRTFRKSIFLAQVQIQRAGMLAHGSGPFDLVIFAVTVVQQPVFRLEKGTFQVR